MAEAGGAGESRLGGGGKWAPSESAVEESGSMGRLVGMGRGERGTMQKGGGDNG